MSLCKDCISGVIHEGKEEGKWEKIGGVDTYVATPTVDYPKDKVLLLLTDIFGPQLINSRLLADAFAANGFKTIVPDYLGGDPVPFEVLIAGKFDLGAWIGKHGQEVTRPYIDKVIAALKEEGITTFYSTGYCFGGRYAFDLAFENIIKVAVVAHPSLLEIPKDLETYLAKSQVPLLINSCEHDDMFGAEAQAKADELLGNGKFAPGYKREHFEGTTHGFAVKGDLSNPKTKAAKEVAFKNTVEWLLKYQ